MRYQDQHGPIAYDDSSLPATTPAAAASPVLPASSKAPAIPSAYLPLIREAASAQGIHPAILSGLLARESSFDPEVISGRKRSRAGALGIAQFMPATAREYGINPLDPSQAIHGAARYLRNMLGRFGGDYHQAVAAYNAGPAGNFSNPETAAYVPAVQQFARQYAALFTDKEDHDRRGHDVGNLRRLDNAHRAAGPQTASAKRQAQLQQEEQAIKDYQDNGGGFWVSVGRGAYGLGLLGAALGNKAGLVDDNTLLDMADTYNIGADPRQGRLGRRIEEADGVLDTTKAVFSDPAALSNLAAEQLPGLALGGPASAPLRQIVSKAATSKLLAKAAEQALKHKGGQLAVNAAGRLATGGSIAAGTTFAQGGGANIGNAIAEQQALIQAGKQDRLDLSAAIDKGLTKTTAEAGTAAVLGSFLPHTLGKHIVPKLASSAVIGSTSELAETIAGAAATGEDLRKSELVLAGVMGAPFGMVEGIQAMRAGQATQVDNTRNQQAGSGQAPVTPVQQPAGDEGNPLKAAMRAAAADIHPDQAGMPAILQAAPRPETGKTSPVTESAIQRVYRVDSQGNASPEFRRGQAISAALPAPTPDMPVIAPDGTIYPDQRTAQNARQQQAVQDAMARVAASDQPDPLAVRNHPGHTPQAVHDALPAIVSQLQQEASAIDIPATARTGGNQIDPARDDLLTALAKLGGLRAAEVQQQLGNTVMDDSHALNRLGLFGKPVLRREGGMALDEAAQRLAEHGYLPVNSHGQADSADLEAALLDYDTPHYTHAGQQRRAEAESASRQQAQLRDPAYAYQRARDLAPAPQPGLTPEPATRHRLATPDDGQDVPGFDGQSGRKMTASQPVPFSKASASKPPTTADQARQQLQGMLGKRRLAQLEQSGLIIHDTADSLPAGLQRLDLHGVQGLYDGHADRIHLLAANLASPEAVRGVLLHEILHRHADTILNPRVRQLLGQRLAAAGKAGEDKDWFDAAKVQAQAANTPDNLLLEEIAAYAIEQYSNAPRSLPQRLAAAVRDFIAGIRVRLHKAGVKLQLTDADLTAMARASLLKSRGRTEEQPERFSFAGAAARTANHEARRQAQALADGHRPPALIHRATGWHQGADGHWRFELDDSKATLKPHTPQMLEHNGEQGYFTHLGQLLDHPELYAAYPDLAGMTVSFSPESDSLGTYYAATDSITLRHDGFPRETRQSIEAELQKLDQLAQTDIANTRQDLALAQASAEEQAAVMAETEAYWQEQRQQLEQKQEQGMPADRSQGYGMSMFSTLMHEIQHAIQQREGFAKGGSPDSNFVQWVKKRLGDQARHQRDAVSQWERSNIDTVGKAEKTARLLRYGLLFESARRLQAYALRDRPSGLKRLIYNELQWLHQPEIYQSGHEARDLARTASYNLPKRHRMAERNAFLSDISVRGASLLLAQIPDDVLASFRQDPRQLASMIAALRREAARAGKPLRERHRLNELATQAEHKSEAFRFKSNFDIYQALAGEVEARNVQSRLDMDAAARRQRFPADTADHRPYQQIVIDATGGKHTQQNSATQADAELPAQIEVNGRQRPTLNEEGKSISATLAGVKNFWRWVDEIGRQETAGNLRALHGRGHLSGNTGGHPGDQRRVGTDGKSGLGAETETGQNAGRVLGPDVRGATAPVEIRFGLGRDGRPRTFYHGTRDDITAFDLNHPNRKDQGWLGTGIYLSSAPEVAEGYANNKSGAQAPNVMPLYAILRNPFPATLKHKQWLSTQSRELVDRWTDSLIAKGYDGVVMTQQMADGPVEEVVVFNPVQVKSAIGNSGDFDPANPDIRFSRRPVNMQAGNFPGTARATPDEPAGTTPPDFAPETPRENLARQHVNRFNRVEKFEASLSEAGIDVPHWQSTSAAEIAYHGRRAERLADFRDGEAAELAKTMAEQGIQPDRLDWYLLARHAEERNRHIAAVNPDMPDGGSGLTTAQAQSLLAGRTITATVEVENAHGKITPEQVQVEGFAADEISRLHQAASIIDRMTAKDRELRIDYGLEDAAKVDQWQQQWQYYVPLAGKAGIAEFGGSPGRQSGFSVRGGQKRAAGRKTIAPNITEQVIRQVEDTINRGEVNRVSSTLVVMAHRLTTSNSMPLAANGKPVIELDPQDLRQYFRNGNLIRSDMPALSGDDIVVARIDGKDVAVRLHDPALADAMRNLDAPQLGTLLDFFAKGTRYLSTTFTAGNPAFWAVAALRDTTAIATLGSRHGAAFVKSALTHVLPAIAQGIRHEFGGKADREFDYFRLHGGRTGFIQVERNLAAKRNELIAAIQAAGPLSADTAPAKVKLLLGRLWHYYLATGAAFETGIRYAAYLGARDQGKSQPEAAMLSKELLTNFNRKGQGQTAAAMAALFPFYNAALQGTRNETAALGDGRVQLALATFGAMVTMSQLLLFASIEEDKRRELLANPTFQEDRQRNILIPAFGTLEDGRPYYRIPLVSPGLMSLVTGTGISMAEMLYQQDGAAMRSLGALGRGIAELAPPPLGDMVKAGTLADEGNGTRAALVAAAPGIAKPALQLAANISHTGQQLIPGSPYDSITPDAYKARSRTRTSWASDAAIAMNRATGGNSAQSGYVDISPESMLHLIRGYGGGIASVLTQGADAFSNPQKGWLDAPVINRFSASPDSLERGRTSMAMATLHRVSDQLARIKRLQQNGEHEAARQLYQDMQQSGDSQLGSLVKQAERQLSQLARRDKALGTRKDDNALQARKQIEKARQGIYSRLIQADTTRNPPQ